MLLNIPIMLIVEYRTKKVFKPILDKYIKQQNDDKDNR